MRKLFALFVALGMVGPVFPQDRPNTFVYFRYDQPSNNTMSLINQVDGFLSNYGRNVLFFEGQKYEGELLDSLLHAKHFLASTSVYDPQTEAESLNRIFVQLLEEYVRTDGERNMIVGGADPEWTCYFLVPEGSSLLELRKLININDLLERRLLLKYYVYDIGSRLEPMTYDELFGKEREEIIVNK